MFPLSRNASQDMLEARESEHINYHIAEHIFEDGCAFCLAEKCKECKGRGMNDKCDICKKCDGRGRII